MTGPGVRAMFFCDGSSRLSAHSAEGMEHPAEPTVPGESVTRPPILMIHGMWAGPWVWQDYVPVFERRGYRCLTPTLRHHDATPLEPPSELGRTSLLDYAADLQREIERLDQPPMLLAHSMGGMLAQMLAARGLARCAALLSPMPPQGFNVISPSSLRMFRRTLTRWGFWRNPTRPTFRDAATVMLEHLPREQRCNTYDRLVHESGRVACETGFWFVDPHRAKWINTSNVTVPLLIIVGSEDRLHTPSMMRKLLRRYEPHSMYIELPHHGHWLTGEPGASQIAVLVADWFDRVTSSAPDFRAGC
jgi:non-heme chloroperoxidase